MFVHLLFLFSWVTWVVANSITPPAMIEIDLVFPLNHTYTLIDPFPVIFVIQNAAVAWNFGFDFTWIITGVADEGSSSEAFGPGLVLVEQTFHYLVPSGSFIVVNSTNFPDIGRPDNLPAGKWNLSWSYDSTICTPYGGDVLEIGSGIPIQGSIGFTVEDGGASPDFTSNCPILAGHFGIVANWSGCPQLGTPGTANPCGAKIDAAQASSISAVLALSTPTTSGTGGSSANGVTSTSITSTSTASTSQKATNIAGREQLGSGLLEAAAVIVGLRILLL
jgi:hypothetical protein